MVWESILLLSIISSIVVLCYRSETEWKWFMFLMPIYIYCIILFTITGRIGILSERNIKLFPGESLCIMLSSPWNNRGGYEYIEAVGNILLFVPFGMFLRKYFKCKYYVLAMLAIIISFLIEYVQFYFMIGTFEIDDVIHNTWGCFIGANMVYLLECLRSRKLPTKDDGIEWSAVLIFLIFNIEALGLYVRFVLKI